MKERFAATIAALGIIAAAAVVVGVCALFYPLRVLIDRLAKKQGELCAKCADVDREQFNRLIYWLPPGTYICRKCRTVFCKEGREEAPLS